MAIISKDSDEGLRYVTDIRRHLGEAERLLARLEEMPAGAAFARERDEQLAWLHMNQASILAEVLGGDRA
jgi:hypothetical protein